jgi:hypothetical protein
MGQIVLVLALAVAAGAAVYRASLYLSGESQPSSSGFLPEEGMMSASGQAADLPPGFRYAVLGPGRRSWQTRLIGFLGIVVLVSIAAVALALAVYEISHLVRLTLDSYLGNPTVTPSPHVGK